MKISRLAAATAAVAITSGLAVTVTHGTTHSAAAAVQPRPAATAQLLAARKPASAADPGLAWLGSRGGQAQVTLNDDIDTLAADLETESYAPTVANHLVFEADARVVRTEARKILCTPALLPRHGRAAYIRMLHDFITLANLLQPGPGYGTTAQDYAAWYKALRASNITVY